MKYKDMVADGETLHSWKEWKYSDEQPVVVLETRIERRVHTGARHDISGHIAKDAVRIRPTTGHLAGQERVVGQKELIGLWSERKPLLDQVAESQARAKAEKAERKARLEALSERLTEEGIAHTAIHEEYVSLGGHGRTVEKNQIRLSMDAGYELLEGLDNLKKASR